MRPFPWTTLSVVSFGCDRGKRPLRRAPLSSLRSFGYSQSLFLPIAVQDLIWESGHCGAPPSHVSVSSPPFPPTHPGPVLDQGKRPLRCAPSSTPRPWTPTYILLLCQSTALIGESGHRGAPPLQLLARGLLPTFSFSPVE